MNFDDKFAFFSFFFPSIISLMTLSYFSLVIFSCLFCSFSFDFRNCFIKVVITQTSNKTSELFEMYFRIAVLILILCEMLDHTMKCFFIFYEKKMIFVVLHRSLVVHINTITKIRHRIDRVKPNFFCNVRSLEYCWSMNLVCFELLKKCCCYT